MKPLFAVWWIIKFCLWCMVIILGLLVAISFLLPFIHRAAVGG